MKLNRLPQLNQLPDIAQQATLAAIPDGAAGVAQTLRQMQYWAKEYKKNPEIRAFAENIIRPVPAKDNVGEVRAIFEWVRDHIRYTQDVRDVETLKTPDATIISGMGDCDDMSLVVATLLESVGYKTRFVAVGTVAPGVFDHVFAQVHLGPNWISLETTEKWPLGKSAEPFTAIMVRHV